MQCINTNIIREMAKKVSLDRLDSLKERKDKIVSRLFMKKILRGDDAIETLMWVKKIYGSNQQKENVVGV
jgi:hypothetical protein